MVFSQLPHDVPKFGPDPRQLSELRWYAWRYRPPACGAARPCIILLVKKNGQSQLRSKQRAAQRPSAEPGGFVVAVSGYTDGSMVDQRRSARAVDAARLLSSARLRREDAG